MLLFYVVDDLRRDEKNIAHFDKLREAVHAYKALPATSWKALGVQDGGDTVDLIRCVPVMPKDQSGEDVMMLEILEHPVWKSRPELLVHAQDLADLLFVRYCLFHDCLLPIPTRDSLPRWLRDKRLWPTVPGQYGTAIHWIEVAGVGTLSLTEFKRRFVEASSVLLAPPQAGELVHSAASPLPTKPEGRLCGDPGGGAFLFPLILRLSAHGQNKNGSYG